VIWVEREREKFCKQDWTARITLIRFNKFADTREAPDYVSLPYGL
jgi:hypothetical protein